MTFFSPIEPPDEPEEEDFWREWTGPPRDVLGGVVAWQALLARSGDVAVSAGHLEAYPTGIAFEITVQFRHGRQPEDWGLHMPTEAPADPGKGLRVGALYSDGRRTEGHLGFDWDDEPDPGQPVLMPHGGGGSDREWRSGYWLWPAPPEGDLVLVVQWLGRGVPETRTTIPAALLADARARAVQLWPDGEAGGAP
jgi:hypothetical protein